jgi:hypothetical protein
MRRPSFRFLSWGRSSRPGSKRRPRSRARLIVEALESRQLLSLHFVAGGSGSGGDGSFFDPWQSIAVVNANIAAGKITPGDTLDFQRGGVFPGNLVFDGQGGAAKAPLTIGDYGDPSAPLPIIQAGNGTGISVRGAASFDISNLEIAGNYDPVFNPSVSDGNGIEFIDTKSSNLAGIFIHDVTIHGFGELPGDKPSGDTGCGIIFYDGLNRPALGYAYQSITISQCEISNCDRSGIELWDDRSDSVDPYSPLMYAGVQIDHVKVHHIITPPPAPGTSAFGGEGILLESVEGAVVQRCQVYNDGSLVDNNGNRLFLDAGVGIWCNHSDHVLFQYNEAHDNHSQAEADEGGFAFGRWTTNSIMQYNYAHDNDGYGYMLESNGVTQLMPENDIIRFNISENDSRQSRYGALLFESWASSNIYVYNNTFYLSDNGLADPSNNNFLVAPAIRFDADDPSAPLATAQIFLYNNIFFTASSTADTPIPVVLVEEGFPTSGLMFQGNDYFSNGPAAFQIDWAGVTFGSMSSWGRDSSGVSADPALGFEYVIGTHHTVSAETVQNIDAMASQLSLLFELRGATPSAIRMGGVSLATVIRPDWWLPDGYNWGGACGPAADLWGSSVPDPYGWYSMGACQF